MAEATETKAEREARWWADWFKADYSWEGLATKEITGGGIYGEKTLQDYWRRDPEKADIRSDETLKTLGELVKFDGRWWHIAHLPLRKRASAEASWKADIHHADWTRLDSLIALRLSVAEETAGVFRWPVFFEPEGQDGRARLDGSVARLIVPSHATGDVERPLYLSCTRAWIPAIDLGRAIVGNGAMFDRATFSDAVNFVAFSGDACFYSATFSGDASFKTFSGDAWFDRAIFSGAARFDSASFSGAARFGGVTFSGAAGFFGTIFSGVVSFDNATFKKRWIVSGRFRRGATVSCASAIFEGRVGFAAWIEAPEASFRRAFYAARFFDVADFSKAVGLDRAGRLACAFVETQFEKALILTDGSDRLARREFHDDTLLAILGEKKGERNIRLSDPEALGEKERERDIRLRDLEAGCRTVKIAMGKARDELREQRYYRFQLQARQMRSDIDGWEKAFGFIYRVTSDFGSSLWRPLAGIVIATALFGYAYAAWGGSLAAGGWRPLPSRDHLFEGQGVALSALKPFSTVEAPKPEPRKEPALSEPRRKVGSSERPKPPSLIAVLTANPAVTLGLRLATAVQVIVSTLLLFLFGLAVKRRFQIS